MNKIFRIIMSQIAALLHDHSCLKQCRGCKMLMVLLITKSFLQLKSQLVQNPAFQLLRTCRNLVFPPGLSFNVSYE